MDNIFFYTDQMNVGYDGKPLISHIRMEVRPGEILTLIGPNGAGKSTILKSITRQLKLIDGTVFMDGKDMQSMSGNEIAKMQAVVLTERIRPEMMTCEDVVSTGRYPYTGTLGLLSEEDKRLVEESMKLVHVLDLRDRDFNAISDGQRQRVLLSRAICQQPRLIVLDEPTSFLDIHHKLSFLTILKRMARQQQIAVIMSLHELDLAQKISDRVMCVRGPAIDRYGTPEEVFDEDYIRALYSMDSGSYDPLFGCMELPAPEGNPEVFVIGGGGEGIPLFRKLQREDTPFITGILPENDMDYEAALHLASRVISSAPYEPVSGEVFEEAQRAMLSCGKVYCPLTRFGPYNEMNARLRDQAAQAGRLVTPAQ